MNINRVTKIPLRVKLRPLETICVFVPIGAMVAILVSWLLALSAPYAYLDANRDTIQVSIKDNDMEFSGRVANVFGMTWASGTWTRNASGAQREAVNADRIPRWSGLSVPRAVFTSPENIVAFTNRRVVAYGWPLRAMWMELSCVEVSDAQQPTQRENTGGMPIGWLPNIVVGRNDLGSRALPLYPIWSGVIVNSCLYALVCLIGWHATRRGREMLRVRTGRCRKCGYPLVAGRCPECGCPAPQNVRANRD